MKAWQAGLILVAALGCFTKAGVDYFGRDGGEVDSEAAVTGKEPALPMDAKAEPISYAEANSRLKANWSAVTACLDGAGRIDASSRYLRDHSARENEFTGEVLDRSPGTVDEKREFSRQRSEELREDLTVGAASLRRNVAAAEQPCAIAARALRPIAADYGGEGSSANFTQGVVGCWNLAENVGKLAAFVEGRGQSFVWTPSDTYGVNCSLYFVDEAKKRGIVK